MIDNDARGLAAQALTIANNALALANYIAYGNQTAYDIWVDSTLGSDSNNGLTRATPKRTLAAAVALLGSNNGKKIGLARGSVWRDTINISNTNIYIGDYGVSGTAQPLIDCSDPLPNTMWSLASGKTVTYQAAITIPGVAANKQWINIYENGVPLTFVADTATVESTAGSYTVPNQTNAAGTVTGSGASTIYIHASDGSNPATNDKTYEYTRREGGVIFNGTGCTLENVWCRRNAGHNGSIVALTLDATVKNCTATDGSKHNILCAGSLLYPTVSEQYYGTSSADMIICYYGGDPTGYSWSITGGSVTKTATAQGNVNAVYSHALTNNWYGGTVTGLAFSGVSKFYDGTTGLPANLTVSGCSGTAVSYFVKGGWSGNGNISNNKVTLTGSNAIFVAPSGTFTQINVLGNFFKAANHYAYLQCNSTSQSLGAVTFNNNTCYVYNWTNGVGECLEITNAASLALSGNTFDGPSNVSGKALNVVVHAMTASNNNYTCNANSNSVNINGTVITGVGSAYIANAQAAQAGLEAGSIQGTKGSTIPQMF